MGTQPENTHGIQTQTQPNPYPKFGSGLGITLGYPNFGYPIPTLVRVKWGMGIFWKGEISVKHISVNEGVGVVVSVPLFPTIFCV